MNEENKQKSSKKNKQKNKQKDKQKSKQKSKKIPKINRIQEAKGAEAQGIGTGVCTEYKEDSCGQQQQA
jgi:hypothetical protein